MVNSIKEFAAIFLGIFCWLVFYCSESHENLVIQIESSRISDEEEPGKIGDKEEIELNSSDFLSRRNEERVNLLRKGCNLDQSIFRESKNMDFDELRRIQLEVQNASSVNNERGSKVKIVENKKQLFDLFDLKNIDLLTCLPPKVLLIDYIWA